MTIRIVLADDHTILRQGLKSLLVAEAEFQVLGEASSGQEALQLVDHLKPDVLVVDVMMPGMNGLEVTNQVHERYPGVKIIILSMHAREAYVLAAFRNGASAYVLKESQAGDLVNAIKDVVQGRRYLSEPLTDRLIDNYIEKGQQVSDLFDALTTREREAFQLVAEGLTSAEIGKRMTVSARTVDVYRSNIMHKLHLKNSTDLIRLALKRGILPEE